VKEHLHANKKIFVDLAETESLTVETLLVLISIIKESKKTPRRISAAVGSSPLNAEANRLLRESGFYSHVRDLTKDGQTVVKGTMRPREGKRVDNALAAHLTRKAAGAVYGQERDLPGVYRTFIELMGNTKQHANPKVPSAEPWWVMSFHEKDKKLARFAFYDAGVGIIGSYLNRLATFLASLPFLPGQHDILHDLLRGTSRKQSRTNLPYRGKGLPAIAKAEERGQISNLRIISNRVMADVSNDQFSPLPEEFQGALICWEVRSP
jgi:hypothetical protein